jgi:hypothetical protein
MSDGKREEQKQENRETQEQANRNAKGAGDEEFAEKIYDDKAPTPSEFEDDHSVSTTGGEILE